MARGSMRIALMASAFALLVACRAIDDLGDGGGSETLDVDGVSGDDPLARYEATRIRGLQPTQSCSAFKPEQGIFVTKREAGEAVEGKIRVLSDNPNNEIYVIGDFNQWGAAKTPDDKLTKVEGSPYFEGKVRSLRHKMQYRLLVNGEQLLDPAATVFTTESFLRENGLSYSPAYLNAVFWDFARPDAYKMIKSSVDLTSKPAIIAEGEVLELARKWRFQDHEGPKNLHDTYRFVAESGLVDELKAAGYNAVEFLPFNTSMDGGHWHYRYQVYGLFAPDSRYGNPDEFSMMIDAFNKAGVAVVMDAVVGHYPYRGNDGARDLSLVGLHKWKKKDGKRLYGEVPSPWGTYRYDYANPYVRRFLTDSIVSMMCHYGISGIRFDNLDGIRLYDGPGGGGPEYLRQLMTEVRAYRPESLLIAEMFFGHDAVLKRLDADGFGIGYRTHSDYFDFVKDNLLKSTQDIDMGRLRTVIRGPWEWKEAPRVQYVTNHDEAANRRDGATGAYVATLLDGGGWYYVEKKTMAFGGLSMISASAYLDMPQMRLLQTGSFNDQSAVEWGLKSQDSQRQVYKYFADLSRAIRDQAAFAFHNFDANVENHVDTEDGRRIISIRRKDRSTGKTYYGIVNLSHVGLSNYRFGVAATGSFRLTIDSDAKAYGGSGELQKRLTSGILPADGPALHGKEHSLSLPYLAPYAAVLIESL